MNALARRILGIAAVTGVLLAWHIAADRPRVFPNDGKVQALAFAPGGKTLAVGREIIREDRRVGWGYATGDIQLRSVADGKIQRAFPFFETLTTRADGVKSVGPPSDIRFSPDGRRLLAANFSNSLGLLDLATGRWLLQKRGIHAPTRRRFLPVGFSSDSRTAYFLRFERSTPFSARAPREVWESIPGVGILFACDAATGAVLHKSPSVLAPGEWPVQLSLLSDGATIACATRLGDEASFYSFSGNVILIDAGTGRRKRVWKTEFDPQTLTVSADGRRVAVTGSNGASQMWNVQTGETRRLGGGAFRATRSADGARLAGDSGAEGINVWDIWNGRLRQAINPREKWIRTFAFAPDGKTLAGAGEKDVKLWRVR